VSTPRRRRHEVTWLGVDELRGWGGGDGQLMIPFTSLTQVAGTGPMTPLVALIEPPAPGIVTLSTETVTV
jgi:hypothetical protein